MHGGKEIYGEKTISQKRSCLNDGKKQRRREITKGGGGSSKGVAASGGGGKLHLREKGGG